MQGGGSHGLSRGGRVPETGPSARRGAGALEARMRNTLLLSVIAAVAVLGLVKPATGG